MLVIVLAGLPCFWFSWHTRVSFTSSLFNTFDASLYVLFQSLDSSCSFLSKHPKVSVSVQLPKTTADSVLSWNTDATNYLRLKVQFDSNIAIVLFIIKYFVDSWVWWTWEMDNGDCWFQDRLRTLMSMVHSVEKMEKLLGISSSHGPAERSTQYSRLSTCLLVDLHVYLQCIVRLSVQNR